MQYRFGLESLHKGRPEAEDQVALEVNVLGLGDRGAFLGALQSQLPLVLALVQVIDAGLLVRAFEGRPGSGVRRNLRAIRQ